MIGGDQEERMQEGTTEKQKRWSIDAEERQKAVRTQGYKRMGSTSLKVFEESGRAKGLGILGIATVTRAPVMGQESQHCSC